ncbi:MAG: hypothetical protein AAB974_03150 [Patescibacteria group bacterium]
MLILRILGYIFASIALLALLLYVFLNVHPAAWEYARQFSAGRAPDSLVGVYDGTLLAPPLSTTWKGKVFRADGTGVNRIGDAEQYPFHHEVRNGRLVIDYTRDANPWWLKLTEDQIVVQEDGAFLGRITLRIGGWRMPLGWFTIVPAAP